MNQTNTNGTSRREFLKNSGRIAVSSALAGIAIPQVHAGESHTIQLALVGCGGRGTGAAENALSVQNGPIKLVAMADVFPQRLAASYTNLEKDFPKQVERAGGPPLHRLRRLQEGHRLPATGGRGALDNPLCVPLGAFRLCHRQRRECLHGKAGGR